MFNSIRWRLTFLMMALAILPIMILGAFIIYQEFNESQSEAHDLQSEIALRVARETQTFIENRPRELRLVTDVRGLVDLSPDEQEAILSEMLAFDPIFDELSLINPAGRETVRVSRRAVVAPGEGRNRSLDDAFQFTLNRRENYYSPVRFDYETGEPLMAIGLPLFDPRTGEIASVLVGEFRLRSIWDLIAAQDFGPGEDLYVVIVASEFDDTLVERVIAHRSPSVVLGATGFDTHERDMVTTGLSGEQVILAVQPFSAGDNEFAVVAEITTSEAYREIYESLYILGGGLAVIALLTGLTGYVVLQRMTRPIITLADAAERLGAGDLSVQVDARARTELGTLARTFNTMAQQLREVFTTLEARVQARTRDLQLAAQVSEQIATILDPDHLLPQVVELTKANFNLYHAHIYLLDETSQHLVLAAGAGEPGRLMKTQGHGIQLQARSLVARTAREGVPNIVNDVREVPDFLPNPLLPHTLSEAAFPLTAGDRVLGVLDVQSEQAGRFETDILAVLSTLAGQIAVAVQNARLFTQTQERSQNLEREQSALVSLAKEPAFSEGDLITALQQVTSVAAQVMNVERVSVWFYNNEHTAIECRMLYEQSSDQFASGVVLHSEDYPAYFHALRERGVIVADNAHTHPDTCEFSEGYLTPLNIQSMLDIPIRVGEQTIGVLCHEHTGSRRRWTLEEEAFGGSMAVMVSLALEAARRNESQAELRKLSQAVEQNPTTVVITNLAGDIEYVNQAFVDSAGYSREEAIGQNPRILKSGHTPAEVYSDMWQIVQAGGTWQGELLNKKKNGDLFWEQVAITPISNARGETTHYLAVKQDITERLKAEEEREQLLEDLQRLSIRLQDRLKEISALQEIGAYSEENLALDEYLNRVAKRVPPSMQHPDICAATIEFEGQLYGDRQIPELPCELVVPVTIAGKQVGTLTVGYVEERDFLPEEQSHLEAIAERVSTYIQSRRLFEQVEKRAAEMQAVSQVGAEAAATLEQNELLWSVANLVKDRFGLYHAHIYLLDERNEYLKLAAGAGNAGKQMVAGGHRIPLRQENSLVVRAVRSGQSVIVNDVTRAPDFLPNPMLPRTRSELATPMMIGGQVIGVLDVQSDELNRFTVEDMQVQSTLASQIAVAVNNAQLFAEQLEVADRLREVDRLKSEFLASMSHELRTPLNSIIGYAEVLLDGIDGDLTGDMTEDVTAIHGSGKHLLNLINDILDLAKIEASQMDLVMEGFRLGPLAEDTASTQRVLLKDRSVDILLDIPDELPAVNADPLRVRQVLSNLLANAIKFTEQGSVTIRARYYAPDPSMLQISVIDTGIGMRDDQLQVIFDRFRQVDQSHTRRAGGTGLGLSITRQLIQLHGGDIWVESAPGAGSMFHFTLPVTVETVEG